MFKKSALNITHFHPVFVRFKVVGPPALLGIQAYEMESSSFFASRILSRGKLKRTGCCLQISIEMDVEIMHTWINQCIYWHGCIHHVTPRFSRYILDFSGFWCDGSSTLASGLALRNLAEFLCFQNLIDFHLIGEE